MARERLERQEYPEFENFRTAYKMVLAVDERYAIAICDRVYDYYRLSESRRAVWRKRKAKMEAQQALVSMAASREQKRPSPTDSRERGVLFVVSDQSSFSVRCNGKLPTPVTSPVRDNWI